MNEFERMAAGTTSTLGLAPPADAGSDLYGVVLCDGLLVSTSACESDADEEHAKKAHDAVVAFDAAIAKRLGETFSKCPPSK